MPEVPVESIQAEIKLEAGDLVALMLHRSRGKRRLMNVLGWIMTLFGVAGLMVLGPDAAIRQSLMISMAIGLWFLFVVWTQKGTLTKAAKVAAANWKPARWTLSRKGLHLETADTVSDLLWSRFGHCLELKSVLVFSGNPGDDLILPKRCLGGAEDIAMIRGWAGDAGLQVS